MVRSTGTRRRRAGVVVVVAIGAIAIVFIRDPPVPAGPAQSERPAPRDGPEPGPLRNIERPKAAAEKVAFPAFTARPFGPPELRVLVRDELDRPIAGAQAQATWPGPSRPDIIQLGGRPTAGAQGITGPFGRMEVWGIPDGPVVVRARASGYVASEGIPASIVRGQTAEIRIELTTGSELEGEVLGEHGEPASEASVRLTELTGDEGTSSLRTLAGAAAESDELGRFRVAGLRPGRYRLVASLGDLRAGLGVVVPSGPVRVRLRPGERPRVPLERRVLAPEEDPPECRVTAERRDRPGRVRHAATEDGGFALFVEPGEYDVLALCGSQWQSARASARVFVPEVTGARVDLSLERGLRWPGRVQDEAGAPVEGVSVRATRADADDPDRVPLGASFTRSDVEGRFVLEGLASTTYRISAWVGHRFAETVASPVGGPLALTLAPEPRLHGQVIRADGTPVARYLVNGREITDVGGQFSYIRWFDEHELRVLAVGIGSAVVPLATRPIPQDLGTIVLTEERIVSGRVIDAHTGAAVPGALLEPGVEALEAMNGFEHYNGGDDVEGSTRSDAMGRFRYPHAAGIPVLISRPGYMRVERMLREGENVIPLQPAAVLEGRVVSAREPTCITAWSEASVRLTSTTEPGGAFRIDGLDRGTWRVTAGCVEDGYPVAVLVAGPGTYSVVVPPPGDL